MLNEKILVSIIIPVYNAEKYIRQCIDSILDQTYKNFEIILVDDNSPDNCPIICDEYARRDSRIKVIHKGNGGAASARNAGLKCVSGNYILFVDSDDFWVGECVLEGLISKAVETDTDVVCFGYKEYFDKSDSCGKFVDVSGFTEKCVSGYETVEKMLTIGAFSSSSCTKLIKTDVVLKNNIFYFENVTSEDVDWCARVLLYSKSFAIYPVNFYRYRQREGSVVHTIKYENLEMLANNIKRCLSYAEDVSDKRLLELYYNYVSYQYISFLRVAILCENDTRTKVLFKDMKKYRWLLKYHLNKKVKIVYLFNKFLGYNLMFKALKFYSKVK